MKRRPSSTIPSRHFLFCHIYLLFHLLTSFFYDTNTSRHFFLKFFLKMKCLDGNKTTEGKTKPHVTSPTLRTLSSYRVWLVLVRNALSLLTRTLNFYLKLVLLFSNLSSLYSVNYFETLLLTFVLSNYFLVVF